MTTEPAAIEPKLITVWNVRLQQVEAFKGWMKHCSDYRMVEYREEEFNPEKITALIQLSERMMKNNYGIYKELGK